MKAHDKQFLIECLCEDIAEYLVDDYNLTVPEALDIIYNSHTLKAVENENAGLYFQGSVYVYDILKNEIKERIS